MAEIKIEKKKPVWPWILALLIIAAVVYFVFFREEQDASDTENTTPVEANDTDNRVQNNADVAAYVDYISRNRDEMSLDHEFTNEAFRKLIAATKATANDVGYDIERDMGQVEEYAGKITNDPYDTTHANSIRKAADTLSAILQNIQQRANPELGNEATAVKNAAAEINPDTLTLDQKSEVKSFFDKASDLLEKINQ